MGLEIQDDNAVRTGKALELMANIARIKEEKKYLFFEPNPKQEQACNSKKPVVAVLGANRTGKTRVHAFYLTCHATGVYPDWWEGPRFNRPVDIGVIGKTNRAVRDVMQTALLGPVHSIGTGMIPRDCLSRNPSKQQGVPDMVDTIFVKHISGGTSTIKLFSCQMDVGVIMGQDWDIAGFDEEPDKDWSDQARMRTVSRRGRMFYTFTPEDGYTEVVNEIFEMPDDSCERITITVDDAKAYYPQDVRERLEREMPEWQKEFRLYGRPSVGEKGRVFKFSRDTYVIDPMDPEPTWRRVGGLDVGYGHATCALDLYIDDTTPEATFYVLNEYYSKEELPDVHAAKLRTWGDVDFYVDPSSKRRAPTDGKNLYSMYEERGLSIFMANNDVDASIMLINQLLANRQLFISAECTHLIDQMGLYRRVIDKKTHRATILKRDDDCFAADTKVLVRREGWVEIQHLVGREVQVWTPIGWRTAGNCKRKPFKLPTVKAIFEDGTSLVCTPDHQLLAAGMGMAPLREISVGSMLIHGGTRNGSGNLDAEDSEVQWGELLQVRPLLQQGIAREEGQEAVTSCGLGVSPWTSGWTTYSCASPRRGQVEQPDYEPAIHRWARSLIGAHDSGASRLGEGEYQEGHRHCGGHAQDADVQGQVCGYTGQDASRMGRDAYGLRIMWGSLHDHRASEEWESLQPEVLLAELQDAGVPEAQGESHVGGRSSYGGTKDLRGMRVFVHDEQANCVEALLPTLYGKKLIAKEECGEEWVYDLTVDEAHCFMVNGGLVASNCIDPLRYAVMAHESARVPFRRKPKPWEVVQKVNVKQWQPFNPRLGY